MGAQSQNRETVLAKNWTFSQKGKKSWYPAEVPGCVHTDLLNNKLIPEPFFENNESKIQWIENEDWEYKTNFKINTNDLHNDKIELVFDGLGLL